MRREFELPSFDVRYLEASGLAWETVIDEKNRWLLLHTRPVPDGYTVATVTLALLIAPGYPDSQIDMVYFNPPVLRKDGKKIGALANQKIGDLTFQRWSRHRTNEGPWRPGEDDVSSHLVLVDDWLERELAKA